MNCSYGAFLPCLELDSCQRLLWLVDKEQYLHQVSTSTNSEQHESEQVMKT